MAGSFSFDFVLLITAEVLAEDPVVAGVDALGVDFHDSYHRLPRW